MEFPVSGHPFVDDPAFSVSAGQSGQVWFLASPFGTVERNVTIPCGKALFAGLLNAEASDLEGLGATAAEQLANANFNADHIRNVAASIDGCPVNDIGSFRVASPQFTFTAPDPWIFSPAPSGAGSAVADGYYLFVKPLTRGNHVIKFSGDFHFSVADGDGFDFDAFVDITYNISVTGNCGNDDDDDGNNNNNNSHKTSGDTEPAANEMLNIFPNPNQGEFQVVLNLLEESRLNVRLYSASGQKIFEEAKTGYRGIYDRKVDLTAHRAGIYFLEVNVNGKSTIEKILYNRD